VSPGASDASLVLRITTIITNAWFDAIAPFHGTAVGVYSRLGRRPPAERATNRNKNIALIYASYRVMNSLLPQHAADWRNMLISLGLDPDDAHTSTADAIGLGNAAGHAVAAAREHDGMNQLGDEGGRRFNRRPYSDYLGYEPVNTAYELHDPSRWQPNIVTEPPVPRLGYLWILSVGAQGLVVNRAGHHAGTRSRPRPVEHVH
jgi:hypothetical protein